VAVEQLILAMEDLEALAEVEEQINLEVLTLEEQEHLVKVMLEELVVTLHNLD
jgi:hypothetical protein